MVHLVLGRPIHNYPYQERKQEGEKKEGGSERGDRELVWSQTFPLQNSKPESRKNGYIVEEEKCKLIILYPICS